RGRGAADDRAFAPINAKFWKSAPFFAQIFDNLGKKCYTRSVRTGRDPVGKRFETPRLPRLSPGGVFWGTRPDINPQSIMETQELEPN
ncbi:MAG: hypothetical protein UDN39_02135, partial [Christensenellales bacterium]|nr:hypothetical protein [Christensenellales bacterium]